MTLNAIILNVRQENILGNEQTRTFIYDLFSITPFRKTAKAINKSP